MNILIVNQEKIIVLLDNIYSIIDSKTQYIIFELNDFINKNDENRLQPRQSSSYSLEDSIIIAQNASNQEKSSLMNRIEKASTLINRLKTLRSKLNHNNVEIIYNLVADNYYLEFSAEELEVIVDGKPTSQSTS